MDHGDAKDVQKIAGLHRKCAILVWPPGKCLSDAYRELIRPKGLALRSTRQAASCWRRLAAKLILPLVNSLRNRRAVLARRSAAVSAR